MVLKKQSKKKGKKNSTKKKYKANGGYQPMGPPMGRMRQMGQRMRPQTKKGYAIYIILFLIIGGVVGFGFYTEWSFKIPKKSTSGTTPPPAGTTPSAAGTTPSAAGTTPSAAGTESQISKEYYLHGKGGQCIQICNKGVATTTDNYIGRDSFGRCLCTTKVRCEDNQTCTSGSCVPDVIEARNVGLPISTIDEQSTTALDRYYITPGGRCLQYCKVNSRDSLGRCGCTTSTDCLTNQACSGGSCVPY